MAYFVEASVEDCTVLTTAQTANEAFAKAIEWQASKQAPEITINDGDKNYSIADFAEMMAQSEIAVAWQAA